MKVKEAKEEEDARMQQILLIKTMTTGELFTPTVNLSFSFFWVIHDGVIIQISFPSFWCEQVGTPVCLFNWKKPSYLIIVSINREPRAPAHFKRISPHLGCWWGSASPTWALFKWFEKKKAKILALRKENGGRRREVEAFCGMTKIHAKKKKKNLTKYSFRLATIQ